MRDRSVVRVLGQSYLPWCTLLKSEEPIYLPVRWCWHRPQSAGPASVAGRSLATKQNPGRVIGPPTEDYRDGSGVFAIHDTRGR